MMMGLRKSNTHQLDNWISKQSNPRVAARQILDRNGGNVDKATQEILATAGDEIDSGPSRRAELPVDTMAAVRDTEDDNDYEDEDEDEYGSEGMSELDDKGLQKYYAVSDEAEVSIETLRERDVEIDDLIARMILDGKSKGEIVKAVKKMADSDEEYEDEDEEAEAERGGRRVKKVEDEDNPDGFYDHFKTKLDGIKAKLLHELSERQKSS